MGGREGTHRGGKSNTRPSKASVRRGGASREAEVDKRGWARHKRGRTRYQRDRARHREGWAHRASRGGSLARPSKVSNGGRRASSEAKERQEGVGGASREALQRREAQAPRMDGCWEERPRPLMYACVVIDLSVCEVIDLPVCEATDLPAPRNGEKAAVQQDGPSYSRQDQARQGTKRAIRALAQRSGAIAVPTRGRKAGDSRADKQRQRRATAAPTNNGRGGRQLRRQTTAEATAAPTYSDGGQQPQRTATEAGNNCADKQRRRRATTAPTNSDGGGRQPRQPTMATTKRTYRHMNQLLQNTDKRPRTRATAGDEDR